MPRREMPEFRFMPYFENDLLKRRPYLTSDMCFDANGRLLGIDIDNASHKLDLHELKMERIPLGAVGRT
jgi:hypothetical protein